MNGNKLVETVEDKLIIVRRSQRGAASLVLFELKAQDHTVRFWLTDRQAQELSDMLLMAAMVE